MGISRRAVLGSGVALAVPTALVVDQRPTAAAPRLPRNPFALGVASGDPRPDGFVIWTRLVQSPLAPDGKAGMPAREYVVSYEIATDQAFTRVVRRGSAVATPTWGHSARAVVTGLSPGRPYWYRWKLDNHLSTAGRSVTAPAPGAMPSRLLVAQLSCANYAAGYYTAYADAALQRPDLMVHLGDYIYDFGPRTNDLRPPPTGKCRTLSDYRLRYTQAHLDPDLQLAHSTSPMLVTFDDHEVEDNYAGLDSDVGTPNFPAVRANAYRAWYENSPVSSACRPGSDGSVRMRRRVPWGRLAAVHLLDTRQYRSDQVCGGVGDCAGRTDPARSILGAEQTAWLGKGLATSPYRWDLLAQQVFFSRRLVDSANRSGYFNDSWDGYADSQQQVISMMGPTAAGPGPRNPVVLTGDTHASWLSRIKADWADPGSATVGTEVACTSVTSAGNGYDGDGTHPFMAKNPHIEFYNALRGYCLLSIRPDRMTVDYRVLDHVRTDDGWAWTRARFVLPDRQSVPVQTADNDPARSAPRVRRAPDDLAEATIREELAS
jgi:alkaline phosphatase D